MSDLIDRKALRQAMYHEAMEKDTGEQRWDSGCWIRYKLFERVLESMPEEQPEPEREKGAWKVYYHGGCDFSYSCNQCLFSAPSKWRFCPNCGAEMRGSDD